MRSLASIVLGFESLVLARVTPVMISIAHVRPAVALPVCLGLAFAAFWVMAIVLGRRIEAAKQAHTG